MKKPLLILLALVLLAGFLCACEGGDKNSLEDAGISIDLPKGMKNASGQLGYQGYDLVYVGSEIAVFGSKGDRNAEGVAENMTLEDCARNAMESAAVDAELITAEKGYVYFAYNAESGFNKFRNVTAFYENGDAFWMIQISSKDKAYDEAAVMAILDSVKFN